MGPFSHFFFLLKEDNILQRDTEGLKKKKLTYFTIEIKEKKVTNFYTVRHRAEVKGMRKPEEILAAYNTKSHVYEVSADL